MRGEEYSKDEGGGMKDEFSFFSCRFVVFISCNLVDMFLDSTGKEDPRRDTNQNHETTRKVAAWLSQVCHCCYDGFL